MKLKTALSRPAAKIKNLLNRKNKTNSGKEEGFEEVKPANPILVFIKSAKFLKITIFLLIIIGLIQIVFGVLIYGFKSEDKVTRFAGKIIPYPVAIVNYNVITYNQYQDEKDYIHHFYKSTGQTDIDYPSIDKEIINQMVENRLIKMTALRYRIKVKDDDVDNTLNQIIDQNGGKENVEKVLEELYGLNLKEFRRLVRDQLLREKIDQELVMRVGVKHILVRVDQAAPQDQIDAGKAKIDGYLAEINGGLDFAEAAKKYTEDTSTSELGGAIEPFSEGEMVPEFSKVAFETPVGEISQPVKTDYGWHIIKVESKIGQIQKSFVDWLLELKSDSIIWKIAM